MESKLKYLWHSLLLPDIVFLRAILFYFRSIIFSALPVFDTLVPPTGINIVSVMRSAITIEWLPARIRNVAQSFIRYNVRLYAANTQRLRSFQRFVGDTQW